MTAAVRTFTDMNVPPGVHTWRVRARDDAGLSATSAPVRLTITQGRHRRRACSRLRMVGGGSGAARYSLKARGAPARRPARRRHA